jgi:carbonyl reductase 1
LQAVQKLEKEDNIKVQFHQLAIDNQQSVERLASFLKQKHGGLDLLINNAGILIRVNTKFQPFKPRQIKHNLHFSAWY